MSFFDLTGLFDRGRQRDRTGIADSGIRLAFLESLVHLQRVQKFRRVSLPSLPTEPTPSVEPSRWFSSEVYPHDGQLRAYLRGRFPDERDVEDVVQESYVRIWKARAATPIRSVKAFLFRVARNVALDRHRRNRGGLETDVGSLSVQNVIDETADVAEAISSLEK